MNDKLVSILADVFDIDRSQICPTLTRADIDAWDSLRQMELVVRIEKEFQIKLTIKEIMSLSSVGSISRIIEDKL